jgi:hypothetical protein
MENSKVGGYSAFTPYTEAGEEVQLYFSKVTKQLLGVKHTPLAVAHQVVNGINFAYLTTAKVVYPDAKDYNAVVIAHVATTGAATLIEIRRIQLVTGSGEGLPGGYTAFNAPTDDVIPKALQKAIGVGVDYTALAIASQVVHGRNYAIFAKAQIVYPETAPHNVLATLYQDVEKEEYYLTSIERVQIL